MGKKANSLEFFLRIGVSLALIAYVFYKAGFAQIWQTIKQTDVNYLLLSIAITPMLVFCSAWKWQVILKAFNINVTLWRCFWLYIVGYFFNTILPTNVGGDVVRAYALGKSTQKPAETFSSVFVERFTGLSVLLLMAIIAFGIALHQLNSLWLMVGLAICLFGYASILIIILNPKILHRFSQQIKWTAAQRIFCKLLKFQKATLSLKNNRSAFLFAMINSVLFYLLASFNVYVSALAFRASITFMDALIITPIVMTITMIPISIGGIGLAESAYFIVFSRMGVAGAVGLSVALLLRAKALVAGIVGGLYYATLGIHVKSVIIGDKITYHIDAGDVKGDVKYFSSFEDIMRQRKSALKKYQDIQIGSYNLFTLCTFELVTFFCGYLPGILGYFLRKLLFPSLFKKVGPGTLFGRSMTIQHGKKITIGRKCVIDEYCKLSAQGNGESEIVLGNEVLLGRGTVLGTRDGRIEIGDFSNIGGNCRLGTTSEIKLGKHVLLAANCYIGGAQHNYHRTDVPIMRQGYANRGGVLIGDDVWLGTDVKVLDGITIGNGSVIGAGSVVTRDIPPYSVAMGVPAKVKGSRKEFLNLDDEAA
ncbi:flippase-like domain-containing protein [candidate division KSB1 bacterium]|nr:flippase-like domain-containing protein [candidate division KSB1 bacterium]RQW10208.1 MAG: TIGR00374 family protein [candidate division KSB1 bacterium]